MRTETISVYKFSELSEQAKKKAIEDYREFLNENWDASILTDCMYEMSKDFMSDVKVKPDDGFEVEYSLSYSQGDGVRLIGIFEYAGRRFKVEAARDYIGSHYSHSNSVRHEELVDEEKRRSRKQIERAEAALESWKCVYKELCRKLEKYGYDWIEEELSDSHISEELEINEFEFTADGERWY